MIRAHFVHVGHCITVQRANQANAGFCFTLFGFLSGGGGMEFCFVQRLYHKFLLLILLVTPHA